MQKFGSFQFRILHPSTFNQPPLASVSTPQHQLVRREICNKKQWKVNCKSMSWEATWETKDSEYKKATECSSEP